MELRPTYEKEALKSLGEKSRDFFFFFKNREFLNIGNYVYKAYTKEKF